MPFLELEPAEPSPEPSLREILAPLPSPRLVYSQPPVSVPEPAPIAKQAKPIERNRVDIIRGADGRAAVLSVNGKWMKISRDENSAFAGMEEVAATETIRDTDGRAAAVSLNGQMVRVLRDKRKVFTGLEEI